MQQLGRCLNKLAQVFGMLAVFFLFFLMVGTSLDVLVRSLSGKPISGVFELSELSMVLIVFLGLGWTQIDDAHIRVTVVAERCSPFWQAVLNGIALLLGALLLGILAYPATQDAIHSFEIREFRWGHIAFPIWWAKIALAMGLWFASLQMCCAGLTRFRQGSPEVNSVTCKPSVSQGANHG